MPVMSSYSARTRSLFEVVVVPVINLSNNVATVDVSPAFDSYSKVIIHVDNETDVVAGNDSGRTLEISNPFGNQQMADRILASLGGFQYRPYDATDALLDPAAEIGDAAETTTSFGGIYSRYRKFNALMPADISAPHDEEIDHEYQFETPSEREFTRTVSDVKASILLTNTRIEMEVTERENADNEISSRITQTADSITAEVARATQAEGALSASLSIQASEIAAKVSASGGSSSSFGWSMDATSHRWYSNNQEVMKITASGLIVNGEVNANSGTIGGFTIGASAIYNNISQFGGTQTSGVYVGTDGIQLGQNFKVNSSGSVTASSLALKGTITFLNADGTSAGTLSAADLRTGAYQAANNYGSWNDTTASCSPGGYCYGGAGGGYNWNNTKNRGTSSLPNVYLGSCSCTSLLCSSFYLGSYQGFWQSVEINGVTKTILVAN